MMFIILVSCLIVVRADGIADDVYIDGVRHQSEALHENVLLTWPHSLAVDSTFNNLYFSNDGQITVLSLNTKELKNITGIRGATSFTVNQETHDVYIGTIKGIYKYRPNTGETELVGAADTNIYHVYFKGVLYYTTYLGTKVLTLNNGHSDTYANLENDDVYKLVIDNENDIFFNNNTGLYSQQIESNHTTIKYGPIFANSLALDRNGKVYFSTDDGIYEVIKHNTTYRKVVYIESLWGITFDMNNNLIYYKNDQIIRLNPIVEVHKTNNCSEQHEHTDQTKNNITTDMENPLEGKLHIVDKIIENLVTDQMKLQESIDKKKYDLLQKIYKIVAKNQIEITSKTDKLPPGHVEERLLNTSGSSPQIININISN